MSPLDHYADFLSDPTAIERVNAFQGYHTHPTAKQMNTDTNWTDAREFVGQAEWAEDNAPLLGCVEATYARRLERLVKDQQGALEWAMAQANAYAFVDDLWGDEEFKSDYKQNAAVMDSFNQLRKEMEA